MKKPLVSVVIPLYNRGPLIRSTLDSVTNQTLDPEEIEILVVDDGSSDQSADWIAAHYGERVQIFRRPNGGVARARNFGLQQARGEFVAFLDHDDCWHPDKLRRQLEQMRPDVGVVYCDWARVDERGERVESRPAWETRLRAAPWPQGDVFAPLLKFNFLVSMSVPLVRTQLAREVGGFDGRTVPCDDYDFWLRLSRRTRFAFVDETLVSYRVHAQQQSRDELLMWRATQRAQIKHWRAAWKQPKTLWLLTTSRLFLRSVEPFYQNARAAVARGDWRGVKRALWRGLKRHPLILLTPQWIYIVKRLVTKDARPF